MGVSTIINRVTYAGDGTSTAFSFPYYFTVATDLFVHLYDTALGTVSLLVLGADYTITGTPNAQGIYSAGGGVALAVAPAVGKTVVIVRSPVRTQNYSLLQNGLLSSTALVQQIDYLTLLVQRLQDEVSRAARLPDGMGATFDMQLPPGLSLSPGSAIIVKADGTGLDIGPASWQKVVIPYTSIQFGGLNHAITAFQLPKQAILAGIAIKHTTQFSGGAISAIKFDLGVSGSPTKFITQFDGFQAVSDAAVDGNAPNLIGSFSAVTNILLNSTSVGANLSALTAGSLTVYFQYYILP